MQTGETRNLVLFEGTTGVAAYSVQRGAFEAALDSGGLAPSLPLATVPNCDG